MTGFTGPTGATGAKGNKVLKEKRYDWFPLGLPVLRVT